MRIFGSWFLFHDGETRPILRAQLQTVDGNKITEQFLVDTGADRTVFSTCLFEQLRLPFEFPPSDLQLHGVGGSAPFALVDCAIELSRDDGGAATLRGKFAAFTDPRATDLSVLGRDVLN